MPSTRKRTLATWLSAITVAVATIVTLSALLMSGWSARRSTTPLVAENAFETALARMASRSPYLSISQEGTVHVSRELERAEPADLDTLHVLAWTPNAGQLLELNLPFWFVRLKMNRALGLGTLASVLVRDWGSLDLRVSESDLARRGPGLVLDHTLPSGARILLWTE